jgi:hypothetical protein
MTAAPDPAAPDPAAIAREEGDTKGRYLFRAAAPRPR